jgi:hypothetical protein
MNQPDPSAATVAMWLKTITREQLHEQGWIAINKRFHGIVRAARPYLQAQFPEEQDQEAAFDGFTLALLAVAHFEDIERLRELFTVETVSETAQPSLTLPPPNKLHEKQ